MHAPGTQAQPSLQSFTDWTSRQYTSWDRTLWILGSQRHRAIPSASAQEQITESSGQDICSPDSLPFYNEIQSNINPINITIHADAQCQCIQPVYLPFSIVYVKSTWQLKTFLWNRFLFESFECLRAVDWKPTLKTESESWAITESLAERVQRQFGDDFQHLWQVIRCAVTGRQGGDYQQHFSILLCHVCQQHWWDSCSNFNVHSPISQTHAFYSTSRSSIH